MPNERELDPIAEAAVSWAGGVNALAKKVGCSHTTISFWLNKRQKLDVGWALLLQKASRGKFKAKEIRPEYF